MADKHLLLDFGGVCLLNPVEIHRELERSLGIPQGTLTWMGPLDPSTDPLWQQLMSAEITERQYWHQRARDVGVAAGKGDDWTLRDYMTACYDLPEEVILRPEAQQMVDACHAAGRKAGVLTNDLCAFHGPQWVDSIRFFQSLDALTDASKTGILKPDPRAYQLALDDLGVEREEVVFVDDQPLNVQGARDFGIATVYFDVANPQRSWAEARELLSL